MKHKKLYGEKVNLSEWGLAAVDDGIEKLTVDLKRVVLNAATEAIEIAIKDGGEAYFPIEWSTVGAGDGYDGDPVHNPNIIYFGFPLCENEHEYRCFKADLREMVNRLIEGFETNGEGGPIVGKKYRDVLEKVAGALRDCATKLDDALNRPRKGA